MTRSEKKTNKYLSRFQLYVHCVREEPETGRPCDDSIDFTNGSEMLFITMCNNDPDDADDDCSAVKGDDGEPIGSIDDAVDEEPDDENDCEENVMVAGKDSEDGLALVKLALVKAYVVADEVGTDADGEEEATVDDAEAATDDDPMCPVVIDGDCNELRKNQGKSYTAINNHRQSTCFLARLGDEYA